MKILIYVISSQKAALSTMTKALKDKIPNFDWTVTSKVDEFESALGVFKINASPNDMNCEVDVRWSSPSQFLKDKKKKEKVWEDVQNLVLPALARTVVNKQSLKLTDSQLQHLLGMISESKASFELDHPDGYVIGINKTVGVDVGLTTADISSMLVASWLFKSQGVRLAMT